MAAVPGTNPDFQSHALRLSDPQIDIKAKVAIISEIRDSVDLYRDTADITRFIGVVVPVAIQILRTGQPIFRKDAPEQAFRHAALGTIHRLPHTEAFRPFAVDLMLLMIQLLKTDNEEIGILCVKIILDLNRSNYKSILESHVPAFIDAVQEMFENMENVVKEVFSIDAKSPANAEIEEKDKPLARAMLSFKVLAECPIATSYFMQHYRQLVSGTVKFVKLQAEPQRVAREEAATRGDVFIGVAPGIRDRQAYLDFITAQVKTMNFVAYVHNRHGETVPQFQAVIPPTTVRLLQDCPPEASACRKELLVAVRHTLTSDNRPSFLEYIDSLLDERITIGPGIACQEGLRSLAYTMIADLLHHLRAQLSSHQLSRVIHIYSCNLHNASLSIQIQNMCMKVLITLVECVIQQCSRPDAAQILGSLLETAIEKLDAVHRMHQDLLLMAEATKGHVDPILGFVAVEKAKPIQGASFVTESPEEVFRDLRLLVRTLIHGLKTLLTGLRSCEAPTPDGELMCRLFEGGVNGLTLYDVRYGDPRGEDKELMEWFNKVLHEMEPHVFQEVWTRKAEFFIGVTVVYPSLIALPQILLSSDMVSHQLVSILLRHLVDRLDSLGNQDIRHAGATLRVFKMCFMAVSLLPELNEPVLVPHIPRLIIDSFPLAAKSSEPTNYFLLLRALFRAVGGGKFEALYKEVLPLLHEMLENLNRLVLTSESSKRDLLVELCLTVPVRLTHLLPYLGNLMQPLVFALRSGPELVAQGLRTLELCVDNLTQEFLDPILNPVLRDLMGALHDQLKPLPANHMHAHTTIRILGKLGGRNRRLLHQSPELDYSIYADPASLRISFDGEQSEQIDVGPMAVLAAKTLRHANAAYRNHAFELLKHYFVIFLDKGIQGREREAVFKTTLEGLLDSIHVPDFKLRGVQYLRNLAHRVFYVELSREPERPDAMRRPQVSPLATLFLDILPRCLARTDSKEITEAESLVAFIIEDLVAIGQAELASGAPRALDLSLILHALASRFAALCFEESFASKMAGFRGIVIMTSTVDLGKKWISDRELDFVRAFLSVLKDMPHEVPKVTEAILKALKDILTVCNAPAADDQPPVPTPSKLPYLIGVLILELPSSNAVVRRTAQIGIELLSQLSGKGITELLMPYRERLLLPIYGKPLRALPFQNQIGHIDAVTYALNLQPPIPEPNDELLRMLHESLALADADDQMLIPRLSQRHTSVAMIKLRVACIKLLTASLPVTDFFSKQGQTRQRLTSVYFKLLYSPSAEVKVAAHEGLRIVLSHQSRLPKELLQTGLRPILMNLADPKRLSVPNLEGLARLLELLTNYFKVEIGHKLIDHFRILADLNTLRDAAYSPLEDNEEILKLVRLVNIFHLLPCPGAGIFLEDLVNLVVTTESHLHAASPTPLTEPLARFLDRYPTEAVAFFSQHLNEPRHVRTFRNVLVSKLAPAVHARLLEQTNNFIIPSLRNDSGPLIMSGLLLCLDLVELDPKWIVLQEGVIDALLEIWRKEFFGPVASNYEPMGVHTQEASVLLSLLLKYLEQNPRFDILFDVVAVYAARIGLDLTALTRFFHKTVAMNNSTTFKRELLLNFLAWFDSPEPSWVHKTHVLRVVINPMLLISYSHKDRPKGDNVVDAGVMSQIQAKIFRPMVTLAKDVFPGSDDGLKIELMHTSSILLQHCSELMQDTRKEVVKFAWVYITSEDAIVKQTAYVLLARFFDVFEAPAKLIIRVWTALLRPVSHTEGRNLIRQAIDILAPALPRRFAPEPGPSPWAKLTRKILVEEGHGLSQVVLVYQVIMRHADLFFPYRELFASHMVHSLTKLGLPPSASPETRAMTLDILDLILTWERKRTKESESLMDLDSPQATNDPHAGDAAQQWSMPLALRESCVSYLVRFVVTSPPDTGPKSIFVSRALNILRDLLTIPGWGEVAIKLGFFHRALIQTDVNEQNFPLVANSARLLSIVIFDKPDSWYVDSVKQLQALLEKGMTGSETVLHDILRPLFERLLHALPGTVEEEEAQGDIATFYSFLDTVIEDGLQRSNNISGTLNILQSYVRARPKVLERFAEKVVKAFARICKEHLHAIANKVAIDPTARLIKLCLNIFRVQVPVSLEHRKPMMLALVTLAEKSPDPSICRIILTMSREWVFHRSEGIPMMKEKANLLLKMTSFENKRGDDDLFADYLTLIYDIYTEPSFRRTDLATRLEPPFFLGCRVKDPVLRSRFTDLLNSSLDNTLAVRVQYVLGTQSWEYHAEHNWIPQALDLLLGCIKGSERLTNLDGTEISPAGETVHSPNRYVQASLGIPDANGGLASHFGPFGEFDSAITGFVDDFIRPLRPLLYLDLNVTHSLWISVFKTTWRCLSRKEQIDATRSMISLLGKEYHNKQMESPNNVIRSLLAGVLACSPPMSLPPFLVKYLGKTFNAWHTAIEILQGSLDQVREEENIRESIQDGLIELFAELSEDDMFYGLWRRRCLFTETNAAISFEQNGMWPQAETMYEAAQIKARAGSLPYSEAEYCMWEDHWILAAQKLQQWDVLTGFAESERNHDLLLECAWRLSDWSTDRDTIERTLEAVSDVATPRRRVFEAFTALMRVQQGGDRADFLRILEDAMQLSLRKWAALPSIVSMAHVPLLQHFQQFVELQEAAQIFQALQGTTSQNLEKRSSDLKVVLQAWRERLPNLWDDISVWSDLVAWRQHVFSNINKAYLPLIPVSNPNGGNAASNGTYGYRGYHETAWIINRFAHVARKHQLQEVCHNALTKIYTLPNIEISEAFLKLREQARCHYQNPNELAAGLEVINNTNLIYFSPSQKAEFYTLKGMFIAKLGHNEDANSAFASAVQMDLSLPKAWAEWGRYNDRLFKDAPTDMGLAGNAVSCYLQAAGLYKCAKTRPLLIRILWLLSLDDTTSTVSRAFEAYKGDLALWYWITLIPQLLLSLSHREARHARHILMNIAKLYPQALFFQLRTSREDFSAVRKQQQAAAAARRDNPAGRQSVNPTTPSVDNGANNMDTTETPKNDPSALAGTSQSMDVDATASNAGESADGNDPQKQGSATPGPNGATVENAANRMPRQPWEFVDEIVGILKTAFPLLSLTLETMVDQIGQRFKPSADEELFRFISALLGEGVQQYIKSDTGEVPPECFDHITRVATSLPVPTRTLFENDLVKTKPSLREYVRRLQNWRDRYERTLESRPRTQSLDIMSHWLIEFHHSKFDDIEVPGQYLEHKDSPGTFVKITRFASEVEFCFAQAYWYRRITMLGHDGTKHSFGIQLPSARHCRREERMMQLFRILNSVLSRRKESRKRNLCFHLPAAIPLAPGLRLLENDASYVTLQGIYDQHCIDTEISREEPVLAFTEKMKSIMEPNKPLKLFELVNLKMELMEEIMAKYVPKTVLTNYMIRTMATPSELWFMRKQFATQLSASIFAAYVMCGTSRVPSRFHISRSTGLIYCSEFLPAFNASIPVFASPEAVPFRLTPNMQHFLTPIGVEGILTAGVMSIGRCLTEPEFDLDHQLSLFLRDEVFTWYNMHQKTPTTDLTFRSHVAQNVDGVVKKAEIMACRLERENGNANAPVTAVQSVVSLISQATNPRNLAQMTESWLPWF